MGNQKYEYVIGKIYGMQLLEELFRDKNNRLCAVSSCIICDRGKTLRASDLFNERGNSCTCENSKHELSKSRIYHTYHNMKCRCYNPNVQEWENYGGKGVCVCDEWLGNKGFNNFYEWAINNGYDDTLSIDRIDEDGNYCPENCQWITLSENTAKANKTTQYRKANKGRYYGISPTGERYEFDNASMFSKEHNLNAGCVRQVANGEKKTHKKWLFGFVEEENNGLLQID